MSFKHNRVQKVYPLIGFVSLLPFMALGLLREFNLLEFIELKTLDGRLQSIPFHSQQVSPQILLITIDDKSEAELGPLPWPPDIYASLLVSLQTANPKAIGLIMWFNREWNDEQLLPGQKLFVIQPYRVPHTADRRMPPKLPTGTGYRTA